MKQTLQATPIFRFVKRRRLALIFAALLLCALVPRLLVFDRTLPYEDYTDEVTYVIFGMHIRGVENAPYMDEARYAPPPVYPYINAAIQELYERLHPQPWYMLGDYLYVLRLVSVFLGLFTILAMASVSWQLAGPAAGWLVAFVWSFAPLIVEHSSLAYPDPYNYLFMALILSLSVRAWKEKSPRWLFGSLIFGIAMIYTKTWPLTAVLPFVLLALVFTYRQPRRMLPWLGLYGVVAGVAMAYFVWGIKPLDVSEVSRETHTFRDEGLRLALTPSRFLHNFAYAMFPVGRVLFWGGIVGGLAAYLYNRKHRVRTVPLYYVVLFLLFALLMSMMAASFTRVSIQKVRHAMPTVAIHMAIWSAMVVQMGWALRHWMAQRGHRGWRVRWGAALPLFVAFAILAPRYSLDNLKTIQHFRQPTVVEVLWRWADVNVPNDGIVLTHAASELERTWNRTWGGYDGDRQRQWWYESAEEIARHTPEDYIKRGIMYFMFTDKDRQKATVLADPALDAFIEQLTLVKIIPAGNGKVAGSTAYFYRMAPPQVAADFDYGGQIRLVGYDMSGTQYAPGDTIVIRPYWRIEQRPQSNYSMFIHLYPEDELRIITQYDGAPTDPRRPTLTWDDPDELYIGPDAQIHLPEDLPSGNYRLAIGLYDYLTGQRLTDAEGHDFFEIPITVR